MVLINLLSIHMVLGSIERQDLEKSLRIGDGWAGSIEQFYYTRVPARTLRR